MKYFPLVVFSVLTTLALTACNSSSSGGGTPPGAPTFNLTCDVNVIYTPFATPIVTTASGATTTVIAIHGKNGHPNASHMSTLAADLNTAGYDVVRPFVPWSNTSVAPDNPTWDGSLCTALSYINSLVVAENLVGKSVILLGHSLAGPIVLAYSALSNSTKPDALVVMAPGHFVGTSATFDSLHATHVATAENMVTAGNGDVVATFQTSNQGVMQDIDATANIFLSYHSPNQFPDIKASIPENTVPTLWLAGLTDSLTNSAKALGIISVVNTRSNYDYQEITGGHIDLASNVTAELDLWFQALP